MSRYFRNIAERALGLSPMLVSTAFFVREDSEIEEGTLDVMPATQEQSPNPVIQIFSVHDLETRVESQLHEVQHSHSEELRNTETHHTHESAVQSRELTETVVREVMTPVEVRQKETLRELLREANRETIERVQVQTNRLERQTQETERLMERATERETRHTERIEHLHSQERTEVKTTQTSPDTAEPVVNISIGHIEIRSTGPQTRQSPTGAPTPKRGISLEDYLRERSGGNR